MLKEVADDHKLRFYYPQRLPQERRDDVPGIVEELKSADANGESTRIPGTGASGASARRTSAAQRRRPIVVASDGINTEGPGLLDAPPLTPGIRGCRCSLSVSAATTPRAR